MFKMWTLRCTAVKIQCRTTDQFLIGAVEYLKSIQTPKSLILHNNRLRSLQKRFSSSNDFMSTFLLIFWQVDIIIISWHVDMFHGNINFTSKSFRKGRRHASHPTKRLCQRENSERIFPSDKCWSLVRQPSGTICLLKTYGYWIFCIEAFIPTSKSFRTVSGKLSGPVFWSFLFQITDQRSHFWQPNFNWTADDKETGKYTELFGKFRSKTHPKVGEVQKGESQTKTLGEALNRHLAADKWILLFIRQGAKISRKLGVVELPKSFKKSTDPSKSLNWGTSKPDVSGDFRRLS